MRLHLAQAKADAPALALLAVLVMVTAALAAIIPRLQADAERRALVQAAATAPIQQLEIRAVATSRVTAAQLDQTAAHLAASLAPPLAGLLGPVWASSTTGVLNALPGDGSAEGRWPLEVFITAQGQLDPLVIWQAGRAPTAEITEVSTAFGTLRQLEVAVSTTVAASLSRPLEVGDQIVVSTTDVVGPIVVGAEQVLVSRALLITGLFEPVPGPAWQGSRPIDAIFYRLSRDLDVLAERIVVLTPPANVNELTAFGPVQTVWRFPVAVGDTPVAETAALAAAAQGAINSRVSVVGAPFWNDPVRVVTGLPGLLGQFATDVAATRTLVVVVSLGLVAVAVVSLFAAALMLRARRAPAIALARARGSSQTQLVVVLLAPVLLAVVPICGLALLLVRSHLSALLMLAVAAVTAGVVALTTALEYRRSDRARPRRAHPSWRVAAEVIVVLLAVAATVLLQVRGSRAHQAGVDPVTALVPVLLAGAAAVLALRLGALPVALAARVTRSGRGSPAFVGFVSASRARSGVAALFVLVISVTFSVFASALAATVAAGQQQESWTQLGADVAIVARHIGPTTTAALAEIPGVTAVVPANRFPAQLQIGIGEPSPVVVIQLDPAAYAAALGSAGAAADGLYQLVTDTEPAPALVSIGAPVTTGLGWLEVGGARQPVEVLGASLVVPAANPEALPVLLVPASWELPPTIPGLESQLFVMTDGDPAPVPVLATVLTDPNATVTTRDEVLAKINSAPLVRGTRTVIGTAVAAAAAFSLLAVVLHLIASAPQRASTLSVLRTLGMGDHDARLLLATELAPLLLLALATGAATGTAMLPLTDAALDLRPYTGGLQPPTLLGGSALVGPLLLVVALASAVVAVGVVGAVLADRRRQLGTTLRVGGTL